MKKLKLRPDELAVETFAVSRGQERRAGTVEAREAAPTIPPWCQTQYTWICPCTPRAGDY